MGSTPASSLSGTILDGRYELLEPIGAGGVGEVYRARQLKLDRIVAVKVLHESLVTNANFVERFQREARAISRMHHPHCVAVLDFGVLEGRPYLVLEYLPGRTVTSLLDGGPFPPSRAVWIALQLLDTLTYFHRQNVIHRDLKSENLMLVSSGAIKDFLKVLDFGMAKILDSKEDDSQVSQSGLVPGTVSAMAPEQLQQLQPDNRIDIYATGILLFEMTVGRRPFRGPDPAVVARMQLDSAPPKPREILGASGMSSELERIILKALRKDRTKRFPSAEAMSEALQQTPEGRRATRTQSVPRPTAPPPLPPAVAVKAAASPSEPASLAPRPLEKAPPPTPSAALPARRRRWIAGAGLAACALLLITWASRSSREAPRPAPATASLPAQKAAPAAPVATTPPAAAAPAPAPAAPAEEPPAPAPASPGGRAVPWLAHRDLAVVYASRGEAADSFREVKAAFAEDARAAAADQALLEAAVSSVTPNKVAFLLGAFRSNDNLVEALTEAASKGKNRLQRHAALDALTRLNKEDDVDLIGMRLLDVDQAITCAEMRIALKKMPRSTDPRLKKFVEDLRALPATDRQAQCLRPLLERRSKSKPKT